MPVTVFRGVMGESKQLGSTWKHPSSANDPHPIINLEHQMDPEQRNSTQRRRPRANIACQTCRQRKVRCSLNITGVPCIGCAQDNTECVVDTKRQERLRRTRMDRSQHPSTPSTASLPGLGREKRPRESPHAPMQSTETGNHTETHIAAAGNVAPPRGASVSQHDHIELEERFGLDIAAAALGQAQRAGEVAQVPFYTGGGTGPTSALEDLWVSDQSLSRHFLLPSSPSVHLDEEDRKYLEAKGVFTMPAAETCDSLFRSYFHHVHPILPILEPDTILNHHQAGRLREINTLILWCIFFVASNFVPHTVYEQEGYGSRKAMKAAMYARASCMYNHGGELDKIVLLQASLLMAFWHSEADEHTQPWYWMGSAISLCQMLGLHRDPDLSKYNSSVTDRQRHLWRRLWWSCFSRDRWLSLTLGRPLRLDLNDCDTPMPSSDDFLSDSTGIHGSMASYLPKDLTHLANHWVKYIELSILLGDVITMNYPARKPKPVLQAVNDLEATIVRCSLPEHDEPNLSRVAMFSIYHLQLHYHALLGTFYRPFGTIIPDGLEQADQDGWRHRMRLKADAAASHTNTVVEAIAQDGLLGFSGPMTPPLLVPAMQTNLLNCKTADCLSKRLRLNKLTMCMLVLEELQKTYTVASIYRGIFATAIQQLFPECTENILLAHSTPSVNYTYNSTSGAAGEAGQGLTEVHSAVGGVEYTSVPTDELIDMLMDEASIFNFWDTWK